jgi:hypothetical protein
LGLDVAGRKQVLGFWQGETENHEICEALLSELESRGLELSKRILFVTDGGKGIIKALKDRLGSGLMHQRCTIHKDRNIQRQLAKRWRNEADEGSFVFSLPLLPNGDYTVMCSVAEGDQYNHTQHHYLHDALIISAASPTRRYGLVRISFERVMMRLSRQ